MVKNVIDRTYTQFAIKFSSSDLQLQNDYFKPRDFVLYS